MNLKNGIPSHDTFRRVFERINPKQLQVLLSEWVKPLNLCLEGKIVAIDAMGCRKGLTDLIVKNKKADYVLGLKKNHPSLYSEVELLFKLAEYNADIKTDFFETQEKGHGRIEQRTCICAEVGKWFGDAGKGWTKLSTIAKLISSREIGGEKTDHIRYFISSLPLDAQRIGRVIREHWSIENTLHWSLDVVCNEDGSQIHRSNSPKNLAIIRRLAFSIAKPRTPGKMTTKRAQKWDNWDENFLNTHFFSD